MPAGRLLYDQVRVFCQGNSFEKQAISPIFPLPDAHQVRKECATTTHSLRRGAGVVERGGLENRCAFTGTQGSNPCLSAIS